MGFLDELKRLARPYEDEEEEEEFDDFEPVSRSERMDRTGGDRLERKAPKAQDSTGPIFPVENERRSNKVVNIHTAGFVLNSNLSTWLEQTITVGNDGFNILFGVNSSGAYIAVPLNIIEVQEA